MHLRSITLKGFKSFPDRKRLEFSPGVSVIVGPNGSGKSNVTDAVLWALGEQSPLAVRGQSMQDVIFSGGHGLPSRDLAEVEVVIDNSDGGLASEFSEISVLRRLERSGEGEYRLNGARCRLVDVIEALSDSGLGKEMHSVVSQGRVEAIVHSRPHERRLLIEEAAGLGKHRKRRHRAQLKLDRTSANLGRALDVEREARARLRPLKRQAEAAGLGARLERQSLEAQLALGRDVLARRLRELAEREAAVAEARAAHDRSEQLLAEVASRRERAEQAFEEQARQREQRSASLHAARAALDRIALRLERAQEVAQVTRERSARRAAELRSIERSEREGESEPHAERVAQLERELEAATSELDAELGSHVGELAAERDAARPRQEALEAELSRESRALSATEEASERARRARLEAEQALESARREAAARRVELERLDRLLRGMAAGPHGAPSLSEELDIEPGYEQAAAAVLGDLLTAPIADDLKRAERLLDEADGGSALLLEGGEGERASAAPPAPGARPMLELVSPSARAAAVVRRLLRDAWVVPALDALEPGFSGIGVTRSGRVLFASSGELRQAPALGEHGVLERRRRRDSIARECERAAGAEAEANAALERAQATLVEARSARDAAEGRVRGSRRALDEAGEEVSRIEWLIERRRRARGEGQAAVRHARLEAELTAERALAEAAARERAERTRRAEWLADSARRDGELEEMARRAERALDAAHDAVRARIDTLAGDVASDDAAAAHTASELRGCAHQEAELQRSLHATSEAVTEAEVGAQRARDARDETRSEAEQIADRLGFEDAAEEGLAAGPQLDEAARSELEAKVERLERRRAQLGPLNPLAEREYDEALAHVDELERQREDLESALRELEQLIRETDRRIRRSFEETFEAASRNFEETVAHLFPGGRGRLRLVRPERLRSVLAGGEGEEQEPPSEADAEDPVGDPGVEIEVTPAGKATKRLSLMSGGEKSLVALAFLFAVFLSRPCPFYILDEVEAALDDTNIDRFLALVRRCSARAQFILVTHQKRTMDAADRLYGISMGADGASKVISRLLPSEAGEREERRPQAA